MCRMLWVQARTIVSTGFYLDQFATVSRMSKEYQGHGWGIAYQSRNHWVQYRTTQPIWEDALYRFGETDRMLVHARSAFQDRDIVVENNMPFIFDDIVFAFNGELRGVRLSIPGRTGAHKILNLFHRFYEGDLAGALTRTVKVLQKQTRYIRALNMIISNGKHMVAYNYFNEDPEYFTMWKYQKQDVTVVASEPLPALNPWKPLAFATVEEY